MVREQDSARPPTASATLESAGETRWRCTRTVKLRGLCSGQGWDCLRNFKNGKGNIRPRSLRKLIVAIHDLQNKNLKN